MDLKGNRCVDQIWNGFAKQLLLYRMKSSSAIVCSKRGLYPGPGISSKAKSSQVETSGLHGPETILKLRNNSKKYCLGVAVQVASKTKLSKLFMQCLGH